MAKLLGLFFNGSAMTIAIGGGAIDVLVHGRNRYFDNYRPDSIPRVRIVYPFGYCGRFLSPRLTG
jgi:hypothetical protein